MGKPALKFRKSPEERALLKKEKAKVLPFPKKEKKKKSTQTLFKKHDKQKLACAIMSKHEHALMFGGSRSGKTTAIVRQIIVRALKKASKHLITRLHFSDCKRAIFHETFPKVIEGWFPDLRGKIKWNKQDWYVEFPSQDGGKSQIWLGGISDEKQSEKVLGNEYSTIFANEVSQIPYESIITLRSRLAENSGLSLRFFYDLNPCGKSHWTYQEFVLGIIPLEKTPCLLDTGYCILNPLDNITNLPGSYIRNLEAMPKRQRLRYLDGKYLSEVEGALWTTEMCEWAKTVKAEKPKLTVIAVDPAVTNNKNSDETGIIAASIDDFGTGIIHGDYSGKMSTGTWAQRAVNVYYKYEANCIVAEVNQGGDLVEDAIKAIDPTIKVVKVRASKGKFARAEPISGFYEETQLKVRHEKHMPELEEQLTEYVPLNSKKSPDRLDALVWALTYLMLRDKNEVRVYIANG